jgi:hypothetical protein
VSSDFRSLFYFTISLAVLYSKAVCKVFVAIMKFRDGMWLPAEGIRSEYAEQVYSVAEREDGKALSLLCPTKKIRARSDSLNLSTLTVVSMPCHGLQITRPDFYFRISRLILTG